MPHLIESIATLAAMMTLRRRNDDDGQYTAITRYANQVAPMVTAVLVAVGSYKYAPLPPGNSEERLAARIEAGMTKISELTTQISVLEQSQKALTERMDEIYARRTAQVGDLEKRVLACEIAQSKLEARHERGQR